MAAVKARMLSIPAVYTRDLTERERLDALIVKALKHISDDLSEKAASLENGDDPFEE